MDFNDRLKESAKIEIEEQKEEGLRIVKEILGDTLEPKRITGRFTKSHCEVLLDDDVEKIICRFRFGAKKKTVGFFDEGTVEAKNSIRGLNDIYTYADRLKATAQRYLETS